MFAIAAPQQKKHGEPLALGSPCWNVLTANSKCRSLIRWHGRETMPQCKQDHASTQSAPRRNLNENLPQLPNTAVLLTLRRDRTPWPNFRSTATFAACRARGPTHGARFQSSLAHTGSFMVVAGGAGGRSDDSELSVAHSVQTSDWQLLPPQARCNQPKIPLCLQQGSQHSAVASSASHEGSHSATSQLLLHDLNNPNFGKLNNFFLQQGSQTVSASQDASSSTQQSLE